MAQTCNKCSRINPSEASYCYYDGSALAAHGANGGPIHTGSQPFPHPFVFPSGKACHNFDQLALSCHENWKETRELMGKGFLEKFLGGLGRTDLAAAAREAARNPNADRGLDLFLSQLPTEVLREPKLAVEPTEINLGRLSSRADRQFELHLHNQGMRLLYGSVACESCLWLTLGEPPGAPRKVFQFGGELVMPVQIRGKHLRAGKPLEGRLSIDSNGGRFTILVKAEIPAEPFPDGVLAGARSPRQLAHKAKAHPKEAAKLFENGAVARWYESNGWIYPVQGPAATGVGAVQQFFEALGLTPAPKVTVTPAAVALHGRSGAPLHFSLQIQTQENRPVYAHAVSDQSWLEVGRATLNGRTATLLGAVPRVPDSEGETIQAQVTVTANGNQRFVVPVTLEVGSSFAFDEEGSSGEASREAVPVLSEFQFDDLEPSAENVSEPAAVDEFQFQAPADAEEAAPVAEVEPRSVRPPRPPRRPLNLRPLRHAIPAAVLGLALLLIMAWDLLSSPGSIHRKAGQRLGVSIVIPDPAVAVQFCPENRRFGLQLQKESDPNDPEKPKRLTFDPTGATNNTCIKIGNEEHLFGQAPGKWALDAKRRKKLDLVEVVKGQKWQSVMDYGEVRVTQTVVILPNERTLQFDTCLVHYLVENHSAAPQDIGVRFLLDTCIGANNGAAFNIPGHADLLETLSAFKQDNVPNYVQVLERSDVQDPGTAALIALKVPDFKLNDDDPVLDPVVRLVLCQWKDKDVRWDWDFKPLSANAQEKDSCVVVYWPVQSLAAGVKRAMAFTYGLGRATSTSGDDFELQIGRGAIRPHQEFTVTAWARSPQPSQIVRIHLPEGFSLAPGQAEEQTSAKESGQVSWTLQAGDSGSYHLTVTSGMNRADQNFEVRKPSGFR
jgi:hypothetical protein